MPNSSSEFDHTAMEHYGLSANLNNNLKAFCGLMHVEKFNLEIRDQIVVPIKRIDFFRFLGEIKKPVLLFMCYNSSVVAIYLDKTM